jgi:hypothetical protein
MPRTAGPGARRTPPTRRAPRARRALIGALAGLAGTLWVLLSPAAAGTATAAPSSIGPATHAAAVTAPGGAASTDAAIRSAAGTRPTAGTGSRADGGAGALTGIAGDAAAGAGAGAGHGVAGTDAWLRSGDVALLRASGDRGPVGRVVPVAAAPRRAPARGPPLTV